MCDGCGGMNVGGVVRMGVGKMCAWRGYMCIGGFHGEWDIVM